MIPALETAYGGRASANIFQETIEMTSPIVSESGSGDPQFFPMKVLEAMETVALFRDKEAAEVAVNARRAARAADLQTYKDAIRKASAVGEQVSCFYYRDAAEFLIGRFAEPHWRPME